MATESQMDHAIETPPADLSSYPIRVSQYLKMLDMNLFNEDRIELIQGQIVHRATKNTRHNHVVAALARLLRQRVEPAWVAREEKSARLGEHSRPEPDIVVARGPQENYRAHDPAVADIALIAEVADSTYAKDRGPLWRLYAEARVPAYWIVNLNKCRVEAYRRPEGQGREAAYRESSVHGPKDSVPIEILGKVAGEIDVWDILS